MSKVIMFIKKFHYSLYYVDMSMSYNGKNCGDWTKEVKYDV